MKVSFQVMGQAAADVAASAAVIAAEFFGQFPLRIVSIDVAPQTTRATGEVLIWKADVVAESTDGH